MSEFLFSLVTHILAQLLSVERKELVKSSRYWISYRFSCFLVYVRGTPITTIKSSDLGHRGLVFPTETVNLLIVWQGWLRVDPLCHTLDCDSGIGVNKSNLTHLSKANYLFRQMCHFFGGLQDFGSAIAFSGRCYFL